MIELDVKGLKKLQGELNEFQARAKNVDKLFEIVGQKWEQQIQKSFVESKDPYGKAWAKVDRDGRPLLDSGRLVGSINYTINQGKLIVGSPVIYAKVHNEGLNGVIKRQFIPLVDDPDFENSNLAKSLNEIVKDYYLGVFDE